MTGMLSTRTVALRAACERQRQQLAGQVTQIETQVATPDAWLGMAKQALKQPTKWLGLLGGWRVVGRTALWWAVRRVLQRCKR